MMNRSYRDRLVLEPVKVALPEMPYIDKILNFSEVFEIQKKIGQGAFGSINVIKDVETGERYSMKTITTTQPSLVYREISSLRDLSSYDNCDPDIVCFYDIFIFGEVLPDNSKHGRAKKEDRKRTYIILLEYISGIDMHKYISIVSLPLLDREEKEIIRNKYRDFVDIYSKLPPLIPDPSDPERDGREVLAIARWLTGVISRIHSKDYVHLDIKPSNIIASGSNLKLIDWGVSCYVGPDDTKYRCEGYGGTRGYIAPELLNGKYKTNREKYFKTADTFSAGATLFRLLTNKLPYDVEGRGNKERIIPELRTEYLPPPFSQRIDDLIYVILEMIILDPDERISIEEAHELFESIE